MSWPRVVTAGTAVTLITLLTTGCISGGVDGATENEMAQEAERVLKVTDVHEATGRTLLEGPTFGPDGRLYVVDVTAPAGAPKVLRIDLETDEVEPVYTDQASAFTSAQFSPLDDRLYLTDIAQGTITSITADGSDPRVSFEGGVEGQRLSPDDIAFDEEGNHFVSDFTAFPGVPMEAATTGGRVIRIDGRTGEASVIARGLPSPNGISFTADWSGLWLSQYTANRIDLVALNEERTAATSLHPGMYISSGAARVDSSAVDADGNVYQAFEGKPEITVHNSGGDLIATITVPEKDEGLVSATNLAVRPGTTDGYMTVSGEAGGYVYRFESLGKGVPQTNGG